jgi:hypothetical protein
VIEKVELANARLDILEKLANICNVVEPPHVQDEENASPWSVWLEVPKHFR